MFNANFGWLNLDVNCQWTDSEDSAQEIFESYPVQKSMGKLLFVYLGGNSGRSGSGATLQHHVAVLWICWGLKKILSHMVNLGRNQSVWWFQIFFIFNLFQMGWNHHLAVCFVFPFSISASKPLWNPPCSSSCSMSRKPYEGKELPSPKYGIAQMDTWNFTRQMPSHA